MPTKNAAESRSDDLRPEYDLSTLTGGVKGKYYERAIAGTTLVLLEPDVAAAFQDGHTVNQALRALMKVAKAQVGMTHTATLPKSERQPTSRVGRKAKSKTRPRAVRG